MGPTAVERRKLSYAEARERVLAAASPLPALRVPIAKARGKALREDIVATHDLPPFTNSSMDGFAVRSADLAGASPPSPVSLQVVETLAAGRVASRALRAGEAMSIMTGAMIPEGADAVVPVESTSTGLGSTSTGPEASRATGPGASWVAFERPASPRDNIRDAGADVARGETVLKAGRELSAHDLALAIALGFAEVSVGPAPRVAVISTGDELLDPGQALKPGAIRDSNLPMLSMLLEEAGCEVVSARRAPDDASRVTAEIRGALDAADVVITIGGVSAGDFDPVKLSLDEIGGIELWRVAMKPGQPQAFGSPRGKLFFGVPGNPASVACVFEALVRPALRRLQGHSELDRPRIEVCVGGRIESREGRIDFVRAELERRGDAWWATPAGAQVSGHVSPQSRAHALLIVPAEKPRLSKGEEARAWVLRWPESREPHGPAS